MKPLMLLVPLMSVFVVSCGKISAEEVDTNQAISKDNALHNLRQFVKTLDGSVIDLGMQSDSTIGPSCASGDGWATGFIKRQSGREEVKCQTTGSGKGTEGCLLAGDFLTKSYSEQDGQCDASLGNMKSIVN